MKKTKLLALSTLMLAGTLASRNTNAQVIMSEDFNAPAAPALPSGWAQANSVAGASGWVTGAFSSLSSWGTATGTTLPSHPSQVAFVNDWDAGTTAPLGSNTADTLKSPAFSLAGATSPYLNFESFYYNAVITSSGLAEKAKVLGSNDGGATWVVLDTVYPSGWGGVWNTQHINLSSLGTGTNRKIAFTYSDGGGHIIGCALDNVQVVDLNANDAAITALDYNSKTNGISANGQPVSFTVENRGVPISSLSMYYRINGGAPVVQNFTGLSLAGYASQNFTFTTPIAGAAAGSNTIRVGIISVNGSSNAEPVDTVQTSAFTYASAAVQRNGMLERFGSSTGAPDASFSAIFDPLVRSLHADSVGGTFNLINYQMNWPSPGNDRSYNADGNTRKSYYGVTGIPVHYVNGKIGTGSWAASDLTTEIAAASASQAFMDISSTYSVDTFTHKLHVVTQVTPHFTKTGSYHVYPALLDKYYHNTTATTTQLDYYHIMRKMLPSATGHVVTSWVDGVTQTFVDSNVTYTNGNWTLGASSYPTAGSYTFWANPLLNSELVTFVQEDGSKSVMQSQVTAPIPACVAPVAAAISGAGSVCQGATLTLTPSVSGGSWTSSATGVATVSSTGVVTGVGGGTATITYTLTNSCGTADTTAVVTVNPLPSSTLTGSSGICMGGSITLTPSVPGGTWSSSAPGIASVAGGVVVAVSLGTADISYTLTNSCGSSSAVQTVIVSSAPPPPVSIAGASVVCEGSTITLTPSAAGGSWVSSATGVATVAGGVVAGVAGGTADITYTLTNGCGFSSTVQPITVNPLPNAGTITAPDTICVGSTLTVTTSASGGTWSSIGGHATINSGGVVMGTSAGIETVSYSVTNSCGTAHATRSVYVKVCVMDGVAQIANADIQLHPNPTHDVINITSSANIGSVLVTNMVGQKVHEAKFNANTASVNMSSLPDGVYFIKVNDSKVFKVLKQ